MSGTFIKYLQKLLNDELVLEDVYIFIFLYMNQVKLQQQKNYVASWCVQVQFPIKFYNILWWWIQQNLQLPVVIIFLYYLLL